MTRIQFVRLLGLKEIITFQLETVWAKSKFGTLLSSSQLESGLDTKVE